MENKDTAQSKPKKITLKEKKQAQPKAVFYLSPAEKKTIRETVAKNLDEGQANVFFYTSQALGLNPLLNEICAVTYGGQMSIQVMRDGFLTIAHRTGKFAGLESGVNMSEDGKTIIYGWAKVYHKDFQVPVYQEADFEEYNTGRNLWITKPKTMIKKVAESMALRKAFNVSGVYSPEEMEKEITVKTSTPELSDSHLPATPEQIATIQSLEPERSEETIITMTKQQAAETIKALTSKK